MKTSDPYVGGSAWCGCSPSHQARHDGPGHFSSFSAAELVTPRPDEDEASDANRSRWASNSARRHGKWSQAASAPSASWAGRRPGTHSRIRPGLVLKTLDHARATAADHAIAAHAEPTDKLSVGLGRLAAEPDTAGSSKSRDPSGRAVVGEAPCRRRPGCTGQPGAASRRHDRAAGAAAETFAGNAKGHSHHIKRSVVTVGTGCATSRWSRCRRARVSVPRQSGWRGRCRGSLSPVWRKVSAQMDRVHAGCGGRSRSRLLRQPKPTASTLCSFQMASARIAAAATKVL